MSTGRSSGPGGQNVNKVNSRAQVRINLEAAVRTGWLERHVVDRLTVLHASRVTASKELIVTSQDARTQKQNRKACLDKLAAMIEEASVVPRERKIRRGLSEATKAARRDTKRMRSMVKRTRSTPIECTHLSAQKCGRTATSRKDSSGPVPSAHIGRRPPVRPAPEPPGGRLGCSLVTPENGKLLLSENFALQHVVKLQEQIVSLRADLEVETRAGSELSLRNAELEREVLMLHEQLAAVAQGNCVKLDSVVEAVTSTSLEADLKRLRQSGQRMRRRLEEFEVSRQVTDAALAKGRTEIESLRAERDAMRRDLKRAQRLYRNKKDELDKLAGKFKLQPPPFKEHHTTRPLASPPEPSKRLVDQVESLKTELAAVRSRAANLERHVREGNDRAKNLQQAYRDEKSRVRHLEAALHAQRKALDDLVADLDDARATENQRLICLRKEADTYRKLLVDRNLLPAQQDQSKRRSNNGTLPLSSDVSSSGEPRRRESEAVRSPRVLEAT